ncbi:hypothetical protein [Actinocorallia libanotica]|uniref:hypothetical protein n=1 Tax=Actinocorallia libanotica TaxID=46162 RepID=UPI0031E36440
MTTDLDVFAIPRKSPQAPSAEEQWTCPDDVRQGRSIHGRTVGGDAFESFGHRFGRCLLDGDDRRGIVVGWDGRGAIGS